MRDEVIIPPQILQLLSLTECVKYVTNTMSAGALPWHTLFAKMTIILQPTKRIMRKTKEKEYTLTS
jgi:hypothetical protein